MPNAHQVGGINIPAAIGLAVMIAVFAASLLVGGHNTPPDGEPPDDDGRGGGGRGPDSAPRNPQPGPGGIPLDDAEQSRLRLRGERPSRTRLPRRRSPEPERPRTRPTRVNDRQ